MRMRLVAVTAAGLLVAGAGVAVAASSGQTATCTANPAITSGATTTSFDVHCSVPKPAASTTTVTAAPVTTTVTVPPQTVTQTVTATATVTPSPTTTTAAPVQPSGSGIVAYQSLTNQGSVPATVNSVSPPSLVSFPAGTFDYADFTGGASQYGFLLWQTASQGPKGLLGSGVGQTVFQMRANTSTQAGQVPPQSTFTSGGTNPLYLMRADNATQLSGVTLQGTAQGHLYGGLMLYYGTGAQLTDVAVRGIPGDNSANPGETFSINLFRATGATLTRVEIDGRDASGARVGASGLGINFGSGAVVTDLYAHDLQYGHGVASYSTDSPTFIRPVVTGGQRGLNFERVTGTVKIDRPNLTDQVEAPIAIASDTGSAVYNITDPVLPAGGKLRVNVTGFAGNARTQDPAAVHLYVAGVERADLLDLRVTN